MARQQAWNPLDFIIDKRHFGESEEAQWRRPADIQEAGQLAAVIAQHRAALVVNAYRRSRHLEVQELAERIGDDRGWLSGQLSGRYIANFDDLARWAVALDDITLLPVFDSLEELRPDR